MKKQSPNAIKKVLGLLLNSYEEKKNLLEQIYEATLNYFNQPEDTTDQKLKKIFHLLEKRGGFIGQVNEIDQRINACLKFFDNCLLDKNTEYMHLSYTEWQLIAKEKSRIEELLRKIQDKDCQISSGLKGMTADLSFLLKDMQEKKYVLKSYLPRYNQSNGVFLDQKK